MIARDMFPRVVCLPVSWDFTGKCETKTSSESAPHFWGKGGVTDSCLRGRLAILDDVSLAEKLSKAQVPRLGVAGMFGAGGPRIWDPWAPKARPFLVSESETKNGLTMNEM